MARRARPSPTNTVCAWWRSTPSRASLPLPGAGGELVGGVAPGRRGRAPPRTRPATAGGSASSASPSKPLSSSATANLGEGAAEGAGSAAGRALDWRDASAYASRARGERKRPSSGWASLTPTEEHVVALVAEGLTNPQIAERMFVGRATVKTRHLEHI